METFEGENFSELIGNKNFKDRTFTHCLHYIIDRRVVANLEICESSPLKTSHYIVCKHMQNVDGG